MNYWVIKKKNSALMNKLDCSRYSSVQFSSFAQLCPTLCNPMNCSTPGLPVHHQLLEFTQTHVHWVGDTSQPSHPLSSPSPPAPNPSQHQSFPVSELFAWGGQSIGVSASESVLPVNTRYRLLTKSRFGNCFLSEIDSLFSWRLYLSHV